MSFAEQIKKKRKEKGLTCKKVGELAGMSRQHYERYERDILLPNFGTAIRIAEALGCEFQPALVEKAS